MNADAMTDEQYRIYKCLNFVDLKNLPNDEFERSKRFEDSNIFNCSSVIASAFICHLAHRGLKPSTAAGVSQVRHVSVPESRMENKGGKVWFPAPLA